MSSINPAPILAAMTRRGLKQKETAAICHISQATLATFLRGHMPLRVDTLYRLVRGLDLRLEDVLVGLRGVHEQGQLRRVK